MAAATIGDNTGNTAGTDDSYLSFYEPDLNKSTEGSLNVAKYDAGSHSDGILKFTGLSSIAGPVTVSAVTLYLNQSTVGHSGGYVLTFRRVLRNWIELEVTWNTVKTTGGTVTWTTGGARSNGNDRSSTITGTITYTAATGYESFASAQLITDVQDMINNPSTNYGWHIERTDGANDSVYANFVSSEGADASRPYLDITYTSGAGTTPRTFTGTDSLAGGELL